MYPIILLFASIASTITWYKHRGVSTETLALILWASAIMAIVDKAYAYFTEGEEFIDTSIDNIVLGAILTISAIGLWLIYLAYTKLTSRK